MEKRKAIFSDDRVYRYVLDIIWDESLPLCQVIGLNPSTADEVQDDPTVRRCKGFARREGCGGLVMTNIFAHRSTDPNGMLRHPTPIGELDASGSGWANDNHLIQVSPRCQIHIAAWGNHGAHLQRGRQVATLFKKLLCLGRTASGEPKHPLYIAANTPLTQFQYV